MIFIEIQVRHANITDEDRKKVLNRMAVIAGMMLKEILIKEGLDTSKPSLTKPNTENEKTRNNNT